VLFGTDFSAQLPRLWLVQSITDPYPPMRWLFQPVISLACVLGALGSANASSCRDLARKLPDVTLAACEAVGLLPSEAKSVNGAVLMYRDVNASIAPEDTLTPRPPLRVLVMGGIHGDEMSSTSLVLRWLAMAQNPTGGVSAGVNWRFLPLVNPDGLLKARPSRTNARGVDLNRNFPTANWAQMAPVYWEQRTKKDPRRWPGPVAQSEPETRFVVDTIQRWQPDLVVSVHAPYAVLDFDGPLVPPQKLGKLFLDRVGVFPGSLGAYGGNTLGVPVVTLELPDANRTPAEAEVRQIWTDLLRWVDEKLVVAQR
jgi:murein peptide amidase A